MKTLRFALFVSCCAAAPLLAADPPKAVVNFDNWKNYTDIKDQIDPTDSGERAILDQLKQALVLDAKTEVPDGDTLTITFQDIHLAGMFEPWRGPKWDETRVVAPIYPPSFRFTWSLTDPSGKVIRQGKEDMTDEDFSIRATIDPNEPLHFEKDILKDWMHRALLSVKAG